jgi:hypothetical protein
MKRILLTSTALVAFAGAAAADVSFSGDASISYNGTTVSTTTNLGATLSATLDNGYTASASFDIDAGTAGDVSLSNDTSSLTYDVSGSKSGAADRGGDMYGMGTTVNDGDAAADSHVFVGVSAGGFDIDMSAKNDMTNLELGVAGDLGGAAFDMGYDVDTAAYVATIGMTAGGADVTVGAASGNQFALKVGMPLGGLDSTLEYASNNGTVGYRVGTSLDLNGVAVSASVTDGGAVTLGADMAAGGADIMVDYDSNGVDLRVAYDMGNGLAAYAATLDSGASYFAGVEYDLGGGATLTASQNTTGAALDGDASGAADYAAGTSLKVSFSF